MPSEIKGQIFISGDNLGIIDRYQISYHDEEVLKYIRKYLTNLYLYDYKKDAGERDELIERIEYLKEVSVSRMWLGYNGYSYPIHTLEFIDELIHGNENGIFLSKYFVSNEETDDKSLEEKLQEIANYFHLFPHELERIRKYPDFYLLYDFESTLDFNKIGECNESEYKYPDEAYKNKIILSFIKKEKIKRKNLNKKIGN